MAPHTPSNSKWAETRKQIAQARLLTARALNEAYPVDGTPIDWDDLLKQIK